MNSLFQQVPQNVETVMSGGFKTYFYFVRIILERADGGIEGIEAVAVVGDGEGFSKQLTVRGKNAAIVLVFRNVDTNANHK